MLNRIRQELKVDRAHYLTLTILFVVGFCLRSAYLFQPMRTDELTTYFEFAAPRLTLGLSNYSPNNHLFHTALVHLSTTFFGNSEAVIRLPAFIAGVLILPAVYILFRMLYNKWVGLLAMALVVSSSHLITYSTNARGYSTQALLVLLLIISAITIKRGHDNLKVWGVFIGLGTLCFYTLPTTLYFFGAVAFWLLLSALVGDTVTQKKKFIINLITACLLTGLLTVLLYLPVVLKEGMGAITSNPWVRPLTFSILFNSTGTLLLDTWRIWNLAIPLAVSLVLAIGFLVSILLHRRMARERINLALVMTVWCAAVYLALRSLPFPRTWMPLLLLYVGFSSAGLFYIGSKALTFVRGRVRMGVGSVCVLITAFTLFLCVLVIFSGSTYQVNDLGFEDVSTFRDARVETAYLKNVLRPGDAVLCSWDIKNNLTYYFLRYGEPLGYLVGNKFSAEGPSTARRMFLVDAFAEQHTLAGIEEIEGSELGRARLVRKWQDSRLFLIEVP